MNMPPERKDCYECEHCVYLGEGGICATSPTTS